MGNTGFAFSMLTWKLCTPLLELSLYVKDVTGAVCTLLAAIPDEAGIRFSGGGAGMMGGGGAPALGIIPPFGPTILR